MLHPTRLAPHLGTDRYPTAADKQKGSQRIRQAKHWHPRGGARGAGRGAVGVRRATWADDGALKRDGSHAVPVPELPTDELGLGGALTAENINEG